MPKNPAKYVVKFFNICDVKTAYLCDSIPYTGKSVKTVKTRQKLGKKLSSLFHLDLITIIDAYMHGQ